jgi:hypothetical protein
MCHHAKASATMIASIANGGPAALNRHGIGFAEGSFGYVAADRHGPAVVIVECRERRRRRQTGVIELRIQFA